LLRIGLRLTSAANEGLVSGWAHRETDIYCLPVPIEIIAKRLNITLEAFPLGNVFGMLVKLEVIGRPRIATGKNAPVTWSD
jgi:hypothetical protein